MNATFTPANPPELKPIASHRHAGLPRGQIVSARRQSRRLSGSPTEHFGGVTVSADDFAADEARRFRSCARAGRLASLCRAGAGFHAVAGNFCARGFRRDQRAEQQAGGDDQHPSFQRAGQGSGGNATEEFLAIWRQIAAHYKNFPKQLAFELDNEPHENATTALMNPIYARAIAEIRQTQSEADDFCGAGRLGRHWRVEKSRAAAG